MRDHFADLDFLDRQDLCLGSDSEGFSYHYFSAFGATDIRIYKQMAMVEPAIRKAKNQVGVHKKMQGKINTSKGKEKQWLLPLHSAVIYIFIFRKSLNSPLQ